MRKWASIQDDSEDTYLLLDFILDLENLEKNRSDSKKNILKYIEHSLKDEQSFLFMGEYLIDSIDRTELKISSLKERIKEKEKALELLRKEITNNQSKIRSLLLK